MSTSPRRGIFSRFPFLRAPASPAAAPSHAVVVYTRAGCGCCHKALEVLEPLREQLGFTLETIDVDSDPALAAAHGNDVPVVLVDGKVRFRGQVNPVLFRRLLAAGPASS